MIDFSLLNRARDRIVTGRPAGSTISRSDNGVQRQIRFCAFHKNPTTLIKCDRKLPKHVATGTYLTDLSSYFLRLLGNIPIISYRYTGIGVNIDSSIRFSKLSIILINITVKVPYQFINSHPKSAKFQLIYLFKIAISV